MLGVELVVPAPKPVSTVGEGDALAAMVVLGLTLPTLDTEPEPELLPELQRVKELLGERWAEEENRALLLPLLRCEEVPDQVWGRETVPELLTELEGSALEADAQPEAETEPDSEELLHCVRERERVLQPEGVPAASDKVGAAELLFSPLALLLTVALAESAPWLLLARSDAHELGEREGLRLLLPLEEPELQGLGRGLPLADAHVV